MEVLANQILLERQNISYARELPGSMLLNHLLLKLPPNKNHYNLMSMIH